MDRIKIILLIIVRARIIKMEKILEIINEINLMSGKEPIEKLERNTSLRKNLKFDSLDLAVLTAKIEDIYDIDVFEDGVIDTVEEIIEKIEGAK